MYQLIYCSEVSAEISNKQLVQILQKARNNNSKDNITGVLFFNHKYFLQLLEGDQLPINTLYRKVINDNRHTNVTLLNYEKIIQRSFENWAMGFANQKNVSVEVYKKHGLKAEFNPFELETQNLVSFLKELRKHTNIIGKVA